jgi:pyridoxamine 5'-phosphate oxidase
MATDPNYQAALDRFHSLFERAVQLEVHEPAAVSLATVGQSGQPTVRTVLLRGFDERGFVFHTNSQSRKGRQISENPRVALCFYWDSLKEQVLVEGVAAPLPDDESDRYWASRPRDSQLAAWASLQSGNLENRHVLESRFDEHPRESNSGRAGPRGCTIGSCMSRRRAAGEFTGCIRERLAAHPFGAPISISNSS